MLQYRKKKLQCLVKILTLEQIYAFKFAIFTFAIFTFAIFTICKDCECSQYLLSQNAILYTILYNNNLGGNEGDKTSTRTAAVWKCSFANPKWEMETPLVIPLGLHRTFYFNQKIFHYYPVYPLLHGTTNVGRNQRYLALRLSLVILPEAVFLQFSDGKIIFFLN